MGQSNFVPDQTRGYVQIPAVNVNAGVNIATFLEANLAGFDDAAGPWLLMVTAETQGFRWRDDGIAPSAAVGHPVAVGSTLMYDANGIANLQAISQTAGCILNVTVFRQRS